MAKDAASPHVIVLLIPSFARSPPICHLIYLVNGTLMMINTLPQNNNLYIRHNLLIPDIASKACGVADYHPPTSINVQVKLECAGWSDLGEWGLACNNIMPLSYVWGNPHATTLNLD